MTRRISWTLLVLTSVLLVLAVLPLAASLTARERIAYRDGQRAATRVIAAVAEETLSDHKSADPMLRELQAAAEAGDCAAVYDAAARLVAATPCAAAQGWDAEELVKDVLTGQEPEPTANEGRLLVAEPAGEVHRPAGVVVLARAAGPLNARVTAIWGWSAAIGALGLASSALLSIRLARWVSRPLSSLDTSARRLGEGALGERADVSDGPPEIRRLAATFNTMAARTEALVHGHQAVIADVSHQLRTPLAALRLRLDVLAVGVDDDTATELAAAQEEIARLSRLVDGLLAVARAEQTTPPPTAVRVDEVVAERVAAWSPVAEEHGVRLTAASEGLPPTAAIGAGHLEQILDNLIANAVEAMPDGGTITLCHRATGRSAQLLVRDDGPGMTAEAKAVAFRRFGNPQAKGTGLGLAIVHRLVTVNGGTVHLEDTPGGGLTVVLDLPLSP
ncbi:sensor histidine kinase [Nocardia seriolae]|uniref:histidine kinase n=2 Tax=Nocardia seriolae TaxID=37332 RepID=A0A0B8NDV2_9NOCA|nr:HAMP domain-containing sensor histidine kinase [Nocardia seriolae]APA96510.1 Histidine kinase [Nocardia seriolae]MTJ61576.1 HAMP domain-containing protein [Nocardia seriolae]MTJ71543.1 HAMP domain-containing protein [Nocardia seriolae]MTJ86596.1 HAMP domain-containing protein [Nocardia seriolae]MTK30591.1 HAMP domain-containing protein [Nocardia seriolae]